jgi:hypothetical protein
VLALFLAAAIQAGASTAPNAEALVRSVPSAESFARHLPNG